MRAGLIGVCFGSFMGHSSLITWSTDMYNQPSGKLYHCSSMIVLNH